MTKLKSPAGRLLFGVLLAMMVGTGAPAATPAPSFTGRWRVDTNSLKGNVKPTIIRVADGEFTRDDNPPVKADGLFHPVFGSGYVDETSITIASDHVVTEVDRVRGKLAYTVDYVVSADGDTLTWHVTNHTSPNGQPVKSQTVERRVGLPTPAAHLLSGTWERVSISVDAMSDWILKLEGKRFSWRKQGTGYDAIIGGPPVRIDGDNSGAQAQLTRPRPDTIVETDLSAKGTRDAVMTMRLLPDGKTIRSTAFMPHRKLSMTFYLHRVPE